MAELGQGPRPRVLSPARLSPCLPALSGSRGIERDVTTAAGPSRAWTDHRKALELSQYVPPVLTAARAGLGLLLSYQWIDWFCEDFLPPSRKHSQITRRLRCKMS